MTDDDQLHALRIVFGLAMERLAEQLTPDWAALDNDQRNAIRQRLAQAALSGHLERLAAAARLLQAGS